MADEVGGREADQEEVRVGAAADALFHHQLGEQKLRGQVDGRTGHHLGRDLPIFEREESGGGQLRVEGVQPVGPAVI